MKILKPFLLLFIWTTVISFKPLLPDKPFEDYPLYSGKDLGVNYSSQKQFLRFGHQKRWL